MRSLIATLLLLASSVAVAAPVRGDITSLNFVSFGRGDTLVDFNTGSPPIKLGEVTWMNTIAYRKSYLSPRPILGGESLNMTDHSYSSIFVTQFNETWSGFARAYLSSRTATESLDTHREAIFYSGVAMVSRRFETSGNFKWSAGFILPGRAQSLPIVPYAGIDYESDDSKIEVKLAFPTTTASYYPSERWRLWAFAIYDSIAYRLHEDSVLRTGRLTYVRQERILLGGGVRYGIAKYVGINVRVGSTLMSVTSLVDSEFEIQRRSFAEAAPYYLVGLAIGM